MAGDLPCAPGDELYTDEEWHQLTHDPKPSPERLVAIRQEMVALVAVHAPTELRAAEALLMWAELDLLSQNRA